MKMISISDTVGGIELLRTMRVAHMGYAATRAASPTIRTSNEPIDFAKHRRPDGRIVEVPIYPGHSNKVVKVLRNDLRRGMRKLMA
jgi:hypothetical protein